ncbi:Carotenoid 9,10(9',10')-cleavage dioxygenase 1, partial [Dichanthelium oligosanthes]
VQSLLAGQKYPLMQEISKALKSVSSSLLQRFIDSAYNFSKLPVLNEIFDATEVFVTNQFDKKELATLLQGNFGPVNEIGVAVLLKQLVGEVPEDFPEGVYIRNGPNPLNPTQTSANSILGSTSYTHYEGQGMLHATYFNKSSGGEWTISYLNKYVHSDTFELERQKSKGNFIPAAYGKPYAILAAFVLNMVSTIQNLTLLYIVEGPYNINGAWNQPFTSHPKKLLHKVDLKFEESRFIHDIGVTTRYNIVMDNPLRFGISRILLQKQIFDHDMNGKARIGIMPRFGNADSVRWFDVENHCSYHLINCFEDGNEVVIRGCRTLGSVIPGAPHNADKSEWYRRVFLAPDKNSEDFDPSLDGILFSRPYEWRLNLESGTTKEGYLTSEEVAMDFPVINENFIGVRNKYGYTQVVDSVATSKTGLFKYKMIAKMNFDVRDKENKSLISVEYHALQENQFCSGVQFVAKKNGNDEDDGWIITYVHDEGTNISQVYIIDAKRFSEEPTAKITLPQRVPYGFHGNFFYK